MTAAGAVGLATLHLLAARREARADAEPFPVVPGWVDACAVDDIPERRATVVRCAGERVAIFRYDGKLSAVSSVCQHQNGPLGEGRVIDGCIVTGPAGEAINETLLRWTGEVVEASGEVVREGRWLGWKIALASLRLAGDID